MPISENSYKGSTFPRIFCSIGKIIEKVSIVLTFLPFRRNYSVIPNNGKEEACGLLPFCSGHYGILSENAFSVIISTVKFKKFVSTMKYDYLCIVKRGRARHRPKGIYIIFYEKGCQGDRMPCHKAFAPCLRVTEGDRRVTGLTMDFTHITELKWHLFEIKWHFTVVKCHSTDGPQCFKMIFPIKIPLAFTTFSFCPYTL